MDPWGLMNIADAYLDVYIGEHCKQEGIPLGMRLQQKKQNIQLNRGSHNKSF